MALPVSLVGGTRVRGSPRRDCRRYLEHARRGVYSPEALEEAFSEVRIRDPA